MTRSDWALSRRAHRRSIRVYEGLVTVRTEGCPKGEELGIWAYLEPILIRNPETNSRKPLNLKCTLCLNVESPFRGCPLWLHLLRSKINRKRSSQSQQASGVLLQNVYPISMVDSSRFKESNKLSASPSCAGTKVWTLKPLVLSGGERGFGATSTVGKVVVASDGWKSKNANQCLVNFMVNLPNGTRVLQKVVFSVGGSMPPQYAEEVLWETIQGICGNDAQRCVGIVADKFKAKALRNLELQNHWMVNFSCQIQGFFSLIKDFYRELPLFRTLDTTAREVADRIQDVGFWNDVDAAHSLVKMIMGMAEDIDAERPLVGQCLPLWEELWAKVKDWCTKYNFAEGPLEKIVERRFKKNYHPAWSAAFVLDPLHLVRDASGKYLPPFKCLTHEQEKDVDKLVTRQFQVKQRDPMTGKMKIANPQSSRLVWETCLKEFKSLGHSRSGLERAQKLVFVATHAKLEKNRTFSSAEEKDAELFGTMSGEDDMLNEVLADTSSI
ncbi:hypothetical protein Salat_0919900 [Sesamum alatum]|uniref:DUF7963 domain-containing protein n=1 Tax=Sesamum alatum TaxID=300844 RepID=A0AAE1YL75_9LAMI|nr:hypothetical protein Salat_0919900 [Sesamum alatum]